MSGVCVCMCVCMHVCVHVRVHVWCACVRMHVCMHVYVCVHGCVCMCMSGVCVHACVCMCVHVCVHVCVCICVYACVWRGKERDERKWVCTKWHPSSHPPKHSTFHNIKNTPLKKK